MLCEELPGADLLEDKGTVVGSAGESAEEFVEDLGLGYTVSFSWLAGRSVQVLGGDFICPSGAGSCLLSHPGLFRLPRPGPVR